MDVLATRSTMKVIVLVVATAATMLLPGCTDRTSAGGGNTHPQQATSSRPNDVEAAESGTGGEVTAHAAKLGRVLLLKPTDNSSGRMDVFERNLDTDSSKLLISYKSFPETFVWPVVAIKPSPNGAYLALIESVDALRGGGGRCWIWERKTGRISKVNDDPLGDQGFDWLPDRNRLLVHDDAGGIPWEGTYDGSIAIYDPAPRKLNRLGSVKGLILAIPAGKGNIVEVVLTKGDKSSVYLQPGAGERRLLFQWPRLISSIAQSPDGSHFVFFDLDNYYVTDARGRNSKSFKIPVVRENLNTTIKFNKSGTRAAVFTDYSTGEPHINNTQQLWVTDIAGHARRIAKWEELFQGQDLATARALEGWLPDDRSVVISGELYYGMEKPADTEHDWYKLWGYDVSLGNAKSNQFFDSGKGWYGVAWYSITGN